MSRKPTLHLFEGYGVELEYMIVDRQSLDPLPVSDRVLRSRAGRFVNEVESGSAGWSNEFVLHVIEIKNNLPSPSLSGIGAVLQEQITHINRLLEEFEGRLMPSGMHPWLDPARETKFWNHRYRRIYETYDRIFGCRSHGWANIQSAHLNLSFHGDEEFGRLHAATRLLLPLIPALAASSPVVEGRVTGIMDNRLIFYRTNQLLVPSVTGDVIPEAVFSRREYEKEILQKMYGDIARCDSKGILRHEWLNSRGAVPRFKRSAMEIRLTDSQECPLADTAVAAAISSAIESLTRGRWSDRHEQASWQAAPLAALLDKTIRSGEATVIRNSRYLKAFGYPETTATAADLWRYLIGESLAAGGIADKNLRKAVQFILDRGTLSRRILKSLGKNPSHQRQREVYQRLCDCLAGGRLFAG
jgi:carboxylate-amine ligase